MNLAKLMWGTVALGAGTAAVIYVGRLNTFQKRLEILTDFNVHKVDLSGITLRVDVAFQNPSKGTVKIKFPTVRLYNGNSLLGYSAVVNKDFTIDSYGETKLDPLFIELKTLTLLTEAPSLLANVRKTGILSVSGKILTTLNGRIPYEIVKPVSLTVPESLRSLLRLAA